MRNIRDFSLLFYPAKDEPQTPRDYAERVQKHSMSELHVLERNLVSSWMREGGVTYNNILDLGCGTGKTLSEYCETFGTTGIGIDINYYAAALAKTSYQNLRFMVGCSESLSLIENESVDHVVVHYAITAFKEPRLALREALRVLKCGGTISVISVNWWYKFWQFPVNLWRRYLPDPIERRYYTKQGLASLMKDVGFSIEKVLLTGPKPVLFPFSPLHIVIFAKKEKNERI